MLTFFMIYMLSGILIGFFSGLLGIGGGIITIPLLVFLLPYQSVPKEMAMHVAISTSLAIVLVTSTAAVYTHYRKKMILKNIFKKMAVGSILGSLIGLLLAVHIEGIFLQRFFGIFLLLLAVQLIFKKEIRTESQTNEPAIFFFTPVIFGSLSTLLGIGGGVLMVPYLNWKGIPLRNSIATASACIFPIALVASIGYMLATPNDHATIPFATGYIYWPAFLGIALTALFFSPLGARASHLLNPTWLRIIFSLFLVIVGIRMLVS